MESPQGSVRHSTLPAPWEGLSQLDIAPALSSTCAAGGWKGYLLFGHEVPRVHVVMVTLRSHWVLVRHGLPWALPARIPAVYLLYNIRHLCFCPGPDWR